MKKLMLIIVLILSGYLADAQTDAGTSITHAYRDTYHYPNNSFDLFILGRTDDMNGDGIKWGGLELTLDTDPELEWISLTEGSFTPLYLSVLDYDVFLETHLLEIGKDYKFDFKICSGTGGGGIGIVVCAQWNNFISHIIPFPINLTSAERSGGSERYLDFEWNVPANEGCTIDHFIVLRSEEEINMYNWKDSEVILTDISAINLNTSFETVFGDRTYNYSIGGCEPDGKLIALSSSVNSNYSKNNFSLIAPIDDSVITSDTTVFVWEEKANCKYDLYLDTDTSYSAPVIISDIYATSYLFNTVSFDNSYQYWKVKAIDTISTSTYWSDETYWRFGKNKTNYPPDGFNPIFPLNADTCTILRSEFSWDIANDAGDIVKYELYIALDSQMDSIIIIDSISNNFFIPQFDLPQTDSLFWKVKAYDSHLDSTEINGGFIHFSCDIDDRPVPFTKIYPHRNLNAINSGAFVVEEVSSQPTFSWHPSYDADGGAITYTIILDDSINFSTPEYFVGITDTSFLYPGTLNENGQYFWDVYAVDQDGDSTKSFGRLWTFVVNDYYEPPVSFDLISPTDTIHDPNIEFSWNNTTDPDPNAVLGYDLWYSTDSTLQTNYAYENLKQDANRLSILYQEPKWVQTTLNAYNGKSWYCGDSSINEYGNNWLQALVSRELDLTSITGNASLKFMHNYDTEGPNYDGGVVQVIDDQDNISFIEPLGSYSTDSLWGFTYHVLSTQPAFSGTSGAWVNEEFDLSSFIGQKIRIRFLFASDEYVCDQDGWYLDDILVLNDSDTLLFDNCDNNSGNSFEAVSLMPQRNKKYYWRVTANDKNSTDPGDSVYSDVRSFIISEYQTISGYAYLDSTDDHSGVLVKSICQSLLADSDSVYTNSSGYFEIKLKPGIYDISYQKAGYESPPGVQMVAVEDKDVVMPEVYMNLYYYIPQNINAIAGSEIKLIWSSLGAVSNFTEYKIYRSDSVNTDYQLIDSISNVNDTIYKDYSVGNGLTYYYKINAEYHGMFESNYSNEAEAFHWYSGPVAYVATYGYDTIGNGTLNLPLETIYWAIRTIGENDTIILLPGSYNEEVNFDGKNLVLSSNYIFTKDTVDINNTVLNGFTDKSTVVFSNSEDTTSHLIGVSIENSKTAIHCSYARPTLENLRIINCTGTGLYLYKSSIRMRNSRFLDEVPGGSSIYIKRAGPIFRNVIIEGHGEFNGGAVYCATYGKPTLENVLFYGNQYAIKCWTYNGGLSSAFVKMNNCIIRNNPIEEFKGTITYSNIEGGWTGTGNIDSDPLFRDPENGDFHLTLGSPCINSGDSSLFTHIEKLDFDGKPRISADTIDMGPYEYGEHWLGSVSTDWHNPANWSMNEVPDSLNFITIPKSVQNMPVINSNANCRELFLNDSSIVIIQNGAELKIGGE